MDILISQYKRIAITSKWFYHLLFPLCLSDEK